MELWQLCVGGKCVLGVAIRVAKRPGYTTNFCASLRARAYMVDEVG
jgi:hypothetical protein